MRNISARRTQRYSRIGEHYGILSPAAPSFQDIPEAGGRSIAGVIKSVDGGNKVSVSVISFAAPAPPPVELSRGDLGPRETPTNATDPEGPATGHGMRSIDDLSGTHHPGESPAAVRPGPGPGRSK